MNHDLDRPQHLSPDRHHRRPVTMPAPTTRTTDQPRTANGLSQPWPASAPSVQQLVTEFHRFSQDWVQRIVQAGASQQLHDIILHTLSHLLNVQERSGHTEHDTLRFRIRDFVTANLHRRVTLSDLSRFLGYSEKYCSELFLIHMGVSFSTYLKTLRVERAKQLLMIDHVSIAQISDWLGFSDQFAFSHFFKKAVGCSPRAYRQRTRAQEAYYLRREESAHLQSPCP